MSIATRPADLESDRALLIDVLSRCLPRTTDGPTFDWLYRANPHGIARSWIATDRATGTVVGIAAAFPRRVCFDSRQDRAWVLGDFCIVPEHRTLGAALELQRACLAGAATEAVTYCYDFPGAGMMAVYRRLRIPPFGSMLRLACPLRVDGLLAARLHFPGLARTLAVAGNALLALRIRPRFGDDSLRADLHHGACGDEFSELARAVGTAHGVCTQRSADYLNWRYLANPLQGHEIVTLRRDGRLMAYAVVTQEHRAATLVDLFGVDEPALLEALVRRTTELLWRQGVATLSALLLESHPWVSLLRRLGFRRRESSPVIVCAPTGAERPVSRSPWLLMGGDRDS